MENRYFNRYSSRISDVYIEIHDFIFRHGTYEKKSNDFVGRSELRSRLRAILTYTDSDSGTYLITGQRGVGKTSLINKVLEELKTTKFYYLGIIRFINLFLVLALWIFVDNFLLAEFPKYRSDSNLVIYILGLGVFFSLFYVGWLSPYRKKKRYINTVFISENKKRIRMPLIFIWVFYAVKEFLIIDRNKVNEEPLVRYVKYVGILCLAHLMHYFFNTPRLKVMLFYGFLLCFFYVVRYFYRLFSGLKQEGFEMKTSEVRKLMLTKMKFSYLILYGFSFLYTSFHFFAGFIVMFFFLFFTCTDKIADVWSKDFILWKDINSNLLGWISIFIILAFIISLLFFWIIRYILPKEVRKKCFFLLRQIYIVFLEKHYFFRHLFDNTKLIYIKINLGYENLKNLDVMRLLVHNITIEYKKYVYSGYNLWIRRICFFLVCILGSLFLTKTIDWVSKQTVKDFIVYVFPSEQTVLRENVVNKEYKNDTLQTISEKQTIKFFRWPEIGLILMDKLKDQVNLGISWCLEVVKTTYEDGKYHKPQKGVDISLLFWCLFFLIAILQFIWLHWWGRGQKYVIRKLEDLQESIAASIKREEGLPLTNVIAGNKGRFWHIGKRVEKNYPMSDVHDIEKKLIDILEKISEKSVFTKKHPNFVIIFDELDKIELPTEYREDVREQMKNDSFSPSAVRHRQQAVFKLLSGLKYFLTTAKAKFIFVAGKEMYEASLADVADRNYYLGSIFNDVIYVPSFMTDNSDGKTDNIFSLTEQYVCQYLFPVNYIVHDYSLKEYNNYLRDLNKRDIEDYERILGRPQNRKVWLRKVWFACSKTMSSEKQREIIYEKCRTCKLYVSEHCTRSARNQCVVIKDYKHEVNVKREKIIFLLNNFILYLTHVGKGAPKKIVYLFEECVVRQRNYKMRQTIEKAGGDANVIVIQRQRNSKYYLYFDFYNQYTFNLMAYLIEPVVLRFNNATKVNRHGDRLLVSSLFFLDHLYKFHQYAFSWRALECSPELIDVNKSAELRYHITDQLHYLSQNHLKQVDNGLYNFRFYKKITNEINVLTRVSEKASAIFDFTLDETYSVKFYYRQKLTELRKQFQKDKTHVHNTVNALASLHFTLGELYLYGEEIEDAILEFDSALSVLLMVKAAGMTAEQIIVLVKIMLSLGVAYERKKLNDQALLIYSEMVKLLVASRNIRLADLNLKIKSDRKSGIQIIRGSKWKNVSNELQTLIQVDKNNPTSNLMTILDNVNMLHPDIHAVVTKFTAYEGIRLLYLPILAKFQILEKAQLGGIQLMDIKRLIKEFMFLTSMVNKENKSFLYADFYSKVGDILFYKNSSLIKDNSAFRDLFKNFPVLKGTDNSNEKCVGCCARLNMKVNVPQKRKPCDACRLYRYTLYLLLEGELQGIDWLNEAISLLINLKKQDFRGWDDNRFNLLATTLSNIGDVLYACIEKNTLIEGRQQGVDFLNQYIKGKKDHKNIWDFWSNYQKSPKYATDEIDVLLNVLKLYILSGYFFKKGTSYNMSSFQLTKLMIIIKDLTRKISPLKILWKDIKDMVFYFAKEAIRELSSSYKDIYFYEDSEFENILTGKIHKRNMSINNDIFEVVLTYKQIEFWCKLHEYQSSQQISNYLNRFYNIFNCMKYNQISGISNRISFLHLKTKVNKIWFNTLLGQAKKFINLNRFGGMCKENIEQLFSFLVADSIFDINEILKFSKIYGETYLLSNIFIAEMQKELLFWISIKELCRDEKNLEKLDIVFQYIPDIKEAVTPGFKELFRKDMYRDICRLLNKLNGMAQNGDVDTSNITSALAKADALRAYYKAKEIHWEGRTYKDMIERACYLNDEYDDRKFHFLMACEIFKINENFKESIGKIKADHTVEGLYDPEKYLYL